MSHFFLKGILIEITINKDEEIQIERNSAGKIR